MLSILQVRGAGVSRWSLGAAGVAIVCFGVLWDTPAHAESPWIIKASRAKKLHKKGVLFLDARSGDAWRKGRIRGAKRIDWGAYTPKQKTQRGKLQKSTLLIAAKLRRLGISKGRRIVVYGDTRYGWGEEGRIVWMLRSLGHRGAMFVDGGLRALRRAGLPTAKGPAKARKTPLSGRKHRGLHLIRHKRWSISRHKLRKLLTRRPARLVVIDTRERREYLGATPYGEKRGGHIPGAKHIHYKALMTPQGTLRSARSIRRLLRKQGITPKHTIVAYCTGGIRSAWFVAVLHHVGFRRVKNYAGSMWEWSAGPPTRYPLQKGPAKRQHSKRR